METTRHFTTKVFIVNNGAIALHKHPKLNILLPPGGHIDRDELPHKAALREVTEETGLKADLVQNVVDIDVPGGQPLPEPAYQILYDVNVHPSGDVGHQHVDFVYFAEAYSREIDPKDGEAPAELWDWYTPERLKTEEIDPDTVQMGIEAIETIEKHN